MSLIFANPSILSSLAVLPVLAIAWWAAGRVRKRRLCAVGLPGVWDQLLVPAAGPLPFGSRLTGSRVIGLLMGCGVAAVIVAAAGPRCGGDIAVRVKLGRDLVIVIDASRSMSAQDALPNRFERARSAVRELIDSIQRRGGHRLALVVFAGRPVLACPLTHDYDHVRSALDEFDPTIPPVRGSPVSGTRIGAAIQLAMESIDPARRETADILLLSDGDDPAGDDEWRIGLSAARDAGVSVHTVGVGDPDRDSPIPTTDGNLQFQNADVKTRLREGPLRELARGTGGNYVAARTDKPDLPAFFDSRIASKLAGDAEAASMSRRPARPAWFFATGFVLLAVAIAAPRVPRIRWRKWWPAAAVPVLVAAAGIDPALDDIRRGNVALELGHSAEALSHYANAVERTTDPGLVAFNQGVALYQLGRYREAELQFRRCLSDAYGPRRTRALYNLGTCLIHLSDGKQAEPLRAAVQSLELALASFEAEESLRLDLNFNLNLARTLLAGAKPAADSQRPAEDTEPPGPSHAKDKPKTGTPGDTGPVGPGSPSGEPVRAPGAKGEARPTDRPGPPGKGNLPPLPDQEQLMPMDPNDLPAYLDRAAERIAAARRDQLRRSIPAGPMTFPDW